MMKFWTIVLTLIFLSFKFAEASPLSDNVTRVLNELLKKPYDKRIRPLLGENSLYVRLTAQVESFLEVDEKKSGVTIRLSFKQNWLEPRLTFQPGVVPNDTIQLSPDQTKFLWTPDTVIGNQRQLKKFDGHESTFLNNEGLISTSVKFTLTVDCEMAYDYFPFDTQTCSVNFFSFAHDRRDIIYEWITDEPLVARVNDPLNAGQFKLIGCDTKTLSMTTKQGNSISLILRLHLQRLWETYWFRAFLPMVHFTGISLTSLWFKFKTAKIQIMINLLNVALYILYIGLFSTLNNDYVTISGTAIGQYFSFSISFVFSTFLVHAATVFLENIKKSTDKDDSVADDEERHKELGIELRNTSTVAPWEEPPRRKSHTSSNRVVAYLEKLPGIFEKVEPFLKWILTIGFLVTNFIYFGFYLPISRTNFEDFQH